MSDPVARQVQRLLQWYPQGWRDEHGEVVLATAVEAAGSAGRVRVSVGEAWTYRLTGLGMRLDLHVALVSAMLAALVSILGTTLLMQSRPAEFLLASVSLTAASLLTLSLIAALQHKHALAPMHAVAALPLSVVAWSLASAAYASWSVGFDSIDERVPATAFAQAFPALFALAWFAGAVLMSTLTEGLNHRMPRATALTTRVALAIIAPPFIGIAAVWPFAAPVVAAGTLIVLGSRRFHGQHRTQRPEAHASVPLQTRRLTAALALLAAALGLAALAISFTGSLWITRWDSTEAMRAGMRAGQVAALPFIAALTIFGVARRPYRWRPIMIVAISIATASFSSVWHKGSDGLPSWVAIACIAVALAISIRSALALMPVAAWIVAGVAGVLLAVAPAVMLLVVWPLVAPGAALITGLLWVRRPAPGAIPVALTASAPR